MESGYTAEIFSVASNEDKLMCYNKTSNSFDRVKPSPEKRTRTNRTYRDGALIDSEVVVLTEDEEIKKRSASMVCEILDKNNLSKNDLEDVVRLLIAHLDL